MIDRSNPYAASRTDITHGSFCTVAPTWAVASSIVGGPLVGVLVLIATLVGIRFTAPYQLVPDMFE